MERRPHFFFFCRLIHGRQRAPLIVPYVTSVLGCIYQGALAACDSQSPALYRGREGRQHNDLISMLGTPGHIGPGALLRRGTHGCTPFSQHSACNIVPPPHTPPLHLHPFLALSHSLTHTLTCAHNAALHTGFITPCQSAGGSGVSVAEQRDAACVRTWGGRCICFMVLMCC